MRRRPPAPSEARLLRPSRNCASRDPHLRKLANPNHFGPKRRARGRVARRARNSAPVGKGNSRIAIAAIPGREKARLAFGAPEVPNLQKFKSSQLPKPRTVGSPKLRNSQNPDARENKFPADAGEELRLGPLARRIESGVSSDSQTDARLRTVASGDPQANPRSKL